MNYVSLQPEVLQHSHTPAAIVSHLLYLLLSLRPSFSTPHAGRSLPSSWQMQDNRQIWHREIYRHTYLVWYIQTHTLIKITGSGIAGSAATADRSLSSLRDTIPEADTRGTSGASQSSSSSSLQLITSLVAHHRNPHTESHTDWETTFSIMLMSNNEVRFLFCFCSHLFFSTTSLTFLFRCFYCANNPFHSWWLILVGSFVAVFLFLFTHTSPSCFVSPLLSTLLFLEHTSWSLVIITAHHYTAVQSQPAHPLPHMHTFIVRACVLVVWVLFKWLLWIRRGWQRHTPIPGIIRHE